MSAAHGSNDLHTVDWSRQDPHQLATGVAPSMPHQLRPAPAWRLPVSPTVQASQVL